MSIHVVNTPQMRARRWIAVMVFAAAAVVVAPQAFAQEEGPGVDVPAASESYVVAQGETLWSIATAITPDSRDVRDTVAIVKSMNLLDSASIRVGDQLLVPIYS